MIGCAIFLVCECEKALWVEGSVGFEKVCFLSGSREIY